MSALMSATKTAAPHPLQSPGFRRFWIGETTSKLGSSVGSVALPLVAVVTLHAGPILVTGLAAAAWLPWLVIGLVVGAWVDRLPRRPIMICADLASLLLFASVPIAAWCGVLTIAQLLAVALLAGVANVFFETAYTAFLPSLIPEQQLTDAQALVTGSQSAMQVAGPSLAGALAGALGAVTGTMADAVSFLVSAICLRGVRPRDAEVARTEERAPLRQEIAEGVRFVTGDRYLRGLTAFGAVSNLGLIGVQSLLVLFLVRDEGLGSGLVGVLLAAGSVGGVIGASLAGRIGRRLGTARGLLTCAAAELPAALLIPLAGPGPRLVLFVLGTATTIGAVVAGNVFQGAWRPLYVPREIRGRVSTSSSLLNYGTIPLGALLAGALAAALGTHTTLWIMSGVIALAPLILIAGPLRTLRDLPPRGCGQAS